MPQYAVVAYVRDPVGHFLEELRREVYPQYPHLPAHLTILPPRQLLAGEPAAVAALQALGRGIEPFEVTLGAVASFAPVTPTVFLEIAHGAHRMRELHDLLSLPLFQQDEPWPYEPHLTVVKVGTLPEAERAFADALARWAHYHGPRRLLVEQLTFVREGADSCWVDVAPVRLGRKELGVSS
ncbi:MAG: 2'-5' RNA ligase family protein [Acidobacteriota bacterium]|nr:2'-5' RNA ligase family protein [Acidobacteriota bacterium]